MTHSGRTVAALAAGALLLAACGSSSDGTKPSNAPTPTSGRTISADPQATATATTAVPSAALIRSTKVTGETTTIAFTSAFVKALYTRGINTAPTGRAGLDDTHRAQLPISSGTATLYGSAGQLSKSSATLRHAGAGLRVSNTRTRVAVSDILVTLGKHPAVTATLAITSTTKPSSPGIVRLFDLELTKPATRGGGGVTLSGITATLDPEAARALDAAFGTTVFTGFGAKKVGTVTVVVTG